MTAKISQFPFRPDARNQSIAHLYRVEAALIQAGFPVEIGRGSSDEGDPWVAFCHLDSGEVVAHVAIIDGEIVADSPAFTAPVRTADISALLDRLVNGLHNAGFDRHGMRAGPYALLAAIVALATLHMTDKTVAWMPIDPEAIPDLASTIGTSAGALIASAAISVEHAMRPAALEPFQAEPLPSLQHHTSMAEIKIAAIDEAHRNDRIPLIAKTLPATADTGGHDGRVAIAAEISPGALLTFGDNRAAAVPLDDDSLMAAMTAARLKSPGIDPVTDALTAVVSTFDYEIVYNRSDVVIYATGLTDGYHHTFSDGSTVSIIGVPAQMTIDQSGQ